MLVQLRRLLNKIVKNSPAILDLVAPAGFGKTTLARLWGAHCGAFDVYQPAYLDLVKILEKTGNRPYVAIVDNAEQASAADAGMLASIIASAPPNVHVALCGRIDTPLHKAVSIAPHRRLRLGAADLALQEHELPELLAPLAPDAVVLKNVWQVSHGWPAVVLYARRSLEACGSLDGSTKNELVRYLCDEIVDALPRAQFRAAALFAALPGMPMDEAWKHLDHAPAEELIDAQLLCIADGRLWLRPPLAHIIEQFYAAELRAAATEAASCFSGSLYSAAAHLRAGDLPAANRALQPFEKYPRALFGFPYQTLAANTPISLEGAELRSYPALWVAMFPGRRDLQPPEAMIDDAIDMIGAGKGLPASLRGSLAAIAALLSVDAGAPQEGYAIVDRASPDADFEARLMLESVKCALDVQTGASPNGKPDWMEIRRHFYGCHAWFSGLIAMEVRIAVRAGRRSVALTYVERMVAVAERSGSPAAHGSALTWAAITAWLFGDDDRMRAYLAQLGVLLERFPARPFQAVADALSGGYSEDIEEFPRYEAWAKFMAASHRSGKAAVDLVRKSVLLADRVGDHLLRVLTRLALSRLVRAERSQHEAAAAAVYGANPDAKCAVAQLAERFTVLKRFEAIDALRHLRDGSGLTIEISTGRVFRAGKEVRLSLKSQQLLMALAIEGRPIARDVLMDRLWTDESLERSENALRMCVYRARQQLGTFDTIVVDNANYELSREVQTDLTLIRDIGKACYDTHSALPHGSTDFFERVVGGRPSAFSEWEWFVPMERHLGALTADLGIRLAQEALGAGEVERAIRYALSLTNIDPCDEAATELLIRAHLQRGEKHLALAHYRRFARCLREEFGTKPAQQLQDLAEEHF